MALNIFKKENKSKNPLVGRSGADVTMVPAAPSLGIKNSGVAISALGKLRLGIRQPLNSRNCNSPSFHTVAARLPKDRQKSQAVWLNAKAISALGRSVLVAPHVTEKAFAL